MEDNDGFWEETWLDMMSWMTLFNPKEDTLKVLFWYLIIVVSRMGVLLGSTWRTLMVPDRILGWQSHLRCQGLPCLTPRKIPWKFLLISLLEVCQEWGVLCGGTWRTLRVPDRILGWQDHLWCHGLPCLTPRKIPWKFCVNIFIRSVSRMEGPSWRYLEDVDGSWQKAWMTGSSLMSRITMFDLKKDTLKVSCWYLY